MSDPGPAQLAAISGLFSSGVIREMARKGRSSLFRKLACQTLLHEIVPNSECVSAIFEAAFAVLKREGLRNEYIYKAALAHNVLLGTHSLNTATMLCEFRVGQCKADLAILNGTATVYEVKSERDSLARLERQIAAYRKVFARAYVITAESHINGVLDSVPSDVGILVLSRRDQITTMREAVDCPDRTSSSAIFESMRTEEARLILQLLGLQIPAVPNTKLRCVLGELFAKLDPRTAHDGMVKVLKRTRNLLPLSDLVENLPRSLHAAALSIPIRRTDHLRLITAVNTPIEDAMSWA